jgi:penicillin-binding protein 1A
MGAALAGKPAAKHPQPNGIVRVKIDAKTGKRVAPNQTGVYEYFKTKNVPELINTGSTAPTDNQSPLPEDLF